MISSRVSRVGRVVALVLGGAALMEGCGSGGSTGDTSASGTSPSSTSGGGGATSGGGGSAAACTVTAPGPSRGSAIAITPNDTRIVAVNRDVGSVSVLSVDYESDQPKLSLVAEIPVGGEPWQVAIDGCGKSAYVVLRKDQKVVKIDGIDGEEPVKGATADVGSEPTGVALTPNNSKLYVANWVDGTLSVLDPRTLAKLGTVDLNPVLVETGALGKVTPRAALAHPRALSITNNGDGSDEDEAVYVTEWFSVRNGPESANGSNADTNQDGLVYKVKVGDGTASRITLPAVANTGFKDTRGLDTGCFPNQVGAITINGGFAYVTSICASPVGPIGVFTGKNAGSVCNPAQAEVDCGFGGVCTAGKCAPNPRNVQSTTHPAVSVIDLAEGKATTALLDQSFLALYNSKNVPDDASRRLPHIANDIAFLPKSGVAYFSANGADAVFRVRYDVMTSEILEVGSPNNPDFINLAPGSITNTALRGQNPVGLIVANTHTFAFTANEVTRNVTAISLPKQIVAGSDANDPRVLATTALPQDVKGQAALRGKRFFNTGMGRWSLKGQGWGSCQACHMDGLTDNVTWYFARGPRQSTSLDGSFASNDPSDRRIFNWTAIFDEVADFEGNTRGISGGVGALVTVNGNPPAASDRIDLADTTLFPPSGAAGLSGSAIEVTNNNSVLKDWDDITTYVQSIRSPRAPRGLAAASVSAGETLFKDLATGGRCQGCHGGAKWTVSHVFYTPGGASTEALKAKAWSAAELTAAGFPSALLPASTPAAQVMRFGGANPAALDQILCVLRPVGTFGVSPAGINLVAELRQDMTTPAQGNAADGKGYNSPSLLGLAVGAPYFHAGNARTLEELFSPAFGGHWKALTKNANFLLQTDDIESLVAYLLSIDEGTPALPIPAGATDKGGDFCVSP